MNKPYLRCEALVASLKNVHMLCAIYKKNSDLNIFSFAYLHEDGFTAFNQIEIRNCDSDRRVGFKTGQWVAHSGSGRGRLVFSRR